MFTRKEDGIEKSTVYSTKTYTDTYLNFVSHHPNTEYRNQVVIPYVEGVSGRIHQVKKKYNLAPTHHPQAPAGTSKDKVELAQQGELMYQIPCKNCGALNIRQTGRRLKTRLYEHSKDVDNTNNKKSSWKKINV